MAIRLSTKRASVVSIFGVLVAIVLLSVQGHAQVTGATVIGTIKDPSGGAIANVEVSITNTATGITTNVTTDSAGFYTAPNLIPGIYQVTMRADGFQTEVRNGITLTVGGQQVLNGALSLGQTTQTIEVSGEAPIVELSSSTTSAVVGLTTVQELPLNGRDWTSLATLQPGISSANSIQAALDSGNQRGNRGFGAQMTISGTPPAQNSYRIDGINVNDYVNGGPGSVSGAALGVDAIQEFSVLTSNYSAEYGRTSGGVINAISRSGTNQFHGDVYEFLRNSALDARNFFDGTTIPPFKRNQFGGSAGGPIQHGRTFFFGDYEGLRQSLGVTSEDTTFSPDARKGILNFPGGPSTFPAACVATSAPNQCAVTVSPLVTPYLPLWAPPNGALLSDGNTGIFSFAGSQVTTENFANARIDHTFSEKDSLFGSWRFDRSSLSLPDSLDDDLNGSFTRGQVVAIEETHTFTPQLLNSFRLGYSRSDGLSTGTISVINPLSNDLALSSVPGVAAPQISVPGVTAYGGGFNAATRGQFIQNSYQVYDDAFLTKGIHSLKFGFSVERLQDNFFQDSTAGGQFKFGSLAAFLTNSPTSYTAAIPQDVTGRGFRQSILGGYVQDDVHWRPNLTFNLGLRYEMATVPTEANNKLVNLRNLTDTQPTLGSPFFSNPTFRNFEPRVGFAWDPFRNGKTSVRGGFGVFDVLPLLFEFGLSQVNDAPYFLQGSANNLAAGSFPTGAFADIAASTHYREMHIEPDPHRDYVMQWNLTLQRALTSSMTASVAYVGNHGVHQTSAAGDSNLVLPTLTPEGYLWPYPAGSGTIINPNLGKIDYQAWGAESFYDALELQISKKMAHGFQVQGAFTWGKAIDDHSSDRSADNYLNSISSPFWFSQSLNRSLSDYNIGKNLVINYNWNVPSPHSLQGPAAWAAGGWELGGIITLQSGLPFTPLIGGDPLGVNSTDPFAYPNLLHGSGCQSPVNRGNPNDYLKLNCFALPTAPASLAAQCTPFPAAPGTCANLLGNAIRNDVIGPGLVNFDFSVFKNNYIKRISEGFNVQFRVEMFNIFNRANFSPPIDNSTLFDQTGAPVAGAGMIDSTSTPAREIQIALKMIW